MFGLFKSKKEKSQSALPGEFNIFLLRAFPGGDEQIALETSRLHIALNGKLSPAETKDLLVFTKVLLLTKEDKLLESMSGSIVSHEKGRLSAKDAESVYRHITGISGPLFSGGDGSSPDEAVVIQCSLTSVGQFAEQMWLTENVGIENADWVLKTRLHGHRPNGRAFETFVLTLSDGTVHSTHFDITQWYLKN